MGESHEITRLLELARDGDRDALSRLIPLVYDELRRLAHHQKQRSNSETLNTTALVHEAYEKLAHGESAQADRQHFFRVAARAMREVLVDRARKHQRQKRGGGLRPLSLNESLVVPPEQAGQLLALDEALVELATLNARQAQVVELRYFVGLTIPETAEILDLSLATIKRDWTAARAWLHRQISEMA